MHLSTSALSARHPTQCQWPPTTNIPNPHLPCLLLRSRPLLYPGDQVNIWVNQSVLLDAANASVRLQPLGTARAHRPCHPCCCPGMATAIGSDLNSHTSACLISLQYGGLTPPPSQRLGRSPWTHGVPPACTTTNARNASTCASTFELRPQSLSRLRFTPWKCYFTRCSLPSAHVPTSRHHERTFGSGLVRIRGDLPCASPAWRVAYNTGTSTTGATRLP